MYKQIDYYCDESHKTIKMKSEKNTSRSLTHDELKKRTQTNHTIKSPDFFDIGEIFIDNITDHNENIHKFLVNDDNKLVLNVVSQKHLNNKEFNLHIESYFQINPIVCPSKRISLLWIDYFTKKGQRFPHIYEICITTVNNRRHMRCEFYIILNEHCKPLN